MESVCVSTAYTCGCSGRGLVFLGSIVAAMSDVAFGSALLVPEAGHAGNRPESELVWALRAKIRAQPLLFWLGIIVSVGSVPHLSRMLCLPRPADHSVSNRAWNMALNWASAAVTEAVTNRHLPDSSEGTAIPSLSFAVRNATHRQSYPDHERSGGRAR